MKIQKNIAFMLAAVAAASLGCSDDTNQYGIIITCSESICKDADILYRCVNGVASEVKCDHGCRGNDCADACKADRCEDDQTLIKCNDGTEQRITCKNGCYKGRCVTHSECKMGRTKCDETDENFVVNCVDGAWEKAAEPCALGCSEGVCICENGQTSCAGDVLMICEDNDWVGVSCEFGCRITEIQGTDCGTNCTKGVCTNCVEDDKKCIDDVPQICTEGDWVKGEACEVACVDGVCRNCTEGAEGCIQNYHLVCKNNAWQTTVCENKCTNSPCVNGHPGTCEDGLSGCISGTDMVTCVNGRWQTKMCQNGCADDKCIACAEGTSSCFDAGDSPDIGGTDWKVCVEGVWKTDKHCAGGCDSGVCMECVDGAKECVQDNARVCENGKWSVKPCPFGCLDNECRVCEEGTSECVNSTDVKTCSGNEWVTMSCKGGCTNDVCHGCVEGATICLEDNKTLQICEDNTLKTQNCPLGCKNGACKTCEIGATKCEDGWMKECKGQEWKNKKQCSSLGCYYSDACRECKEGDKRCNGNIVEQCDYNTWQANETCTMCYNGSCRKNCIDGETRCGTKNFDDTVEICVDDKWVIDDVCDSNDSCVKFDGSDSYECAEKCYSKGELIYDCDSYSTWVDKYICADTEDGYAYVYESYERCFAGCSSESGCEGCKEGDASCSGSGRYVCEGGDLKYHSCEHGCDSATGECIEPPPCSEGDVMCAGSSSDTVYKCDSSGHWQREKVCDDICNDEGECVCDNTGSYCSGDETNYCSGGEIYSEPCKYGCDYLTGECKDPECTDGATECTGSDTMRVCEDGRWAKEISCQGHCVDNSCRDND